MTGRVRPQSEGGLAPALPRGDRIEAISLDLDDTLWPVMPALVKAEQAMHRWLLDRAPATASLCSVDRIREIRLLVAMANADRAHDMGWLRLESLRQALREGGDDPALAVGAFNVFLDGRQQVTLYGEVEQVLQRWKSRYKLLAVTNGNADIDRIGIAHYFDASVAAHELGVGKPDRRIFEHACARVGLPPSRVLHVGDDLVLDVQGARQAGLYAAWIQRPDLKRAVAGPDPEAASQTGSRARPDTARIGEHAFSDLQVLDQALSSG